MIEPVIRVNRTRVRVQYGNHPALELDFAPLMAAGQGLEPCKNLVLKHWQARPRGERRWGIFQWRDGEGKYFSYVEPRSASCPHHDLQLPEGGPLPTSAIYYPNAIVFAKQIVFFRR